MHDDIFKRVQANPHFHALKAKRGKYGWTLTILMLLVYYGYILIIAFDKELLAKPLGEGVMTWGIPIGVGVIVFTIVLTGIYVRRANSEFDELTRKIVEEAGK